MERSISAFWEGLTFAFLRENACFTFVLTIATCLLLALWGEFGSKTNVLDTDSLERRVCELEQEVALQREMIVARKGRTDADTNH